MSLGHGPDPKKTLNQHREDAGFPPLSLQPTPDEQTRRPLPSHLRWFFAAWAWAVLFGLLAQKGYFFLAAAVLIISASCFVLSHLRLQREDISKPFVSHRHPYR